MKKAALGFLALTLLMLFAAVPVMAKPTDGQKVAVTLKFTPVSGSSITGDRWVTNEV